MSVLPPRSPTSPVGHAPSSSFSAKSPLPLTRPSEVNELGPHAFRPPNGASRSPCPCLNTLANHSYLPHDGRNITFSKIMSSLQEGMGLSRTFALFMAIGTFTLLRRPSLAPFDLHGTARHDFIEHNASMMHDDAEVGAEFAPTEVDLDLLHKFLAKAHPSETTGEYVITQDNIVEGRIEREASSRHVDALHAELGRAEFAMVMEIFGKGKDKELSRAELDVFLRENRFPDGWKPTHTLQLWEVVARSSEMRHAMAKTKEAAPEEHDAEQGVFHWFKTTVGRLLGMD